MSERSFRSITHIHFHSLNQSQSRTPPPPTPTYCPSGTLWVDNEAAGRLDLHQQRHEERRLACVGKETQQHQKLGESVHENVGESVRA